MLQRFPIRVKLFIALAVPLVALIAVAVFEVAQTSRHKSDIDEQAGLATSALSAKGILSKLEDERNAAAIYLLGLEGAVELTVEDPKEAKVLTDEALAPFEDEVAGRGGAVESSYGDALANLSKLKELRGQVEGFTGERAPANVDLASQVFDTYSDLMSPFFDANRRAALEIDDPTLRRGAELIDLTQRQTDIYAKISMKVAIAMLGPPAPGERPDGVNSSTEISELSGLLGELQENKDLIRTKASGDYAPMVKDLLATPHIQQFPGAVASVIYGTSTGVEALEELLGLASGPSAEEQGYTIFRGVVEDQLVSDSDGLVNSAELRTWLLYGVGFVALVIAMLATWLVSRSITRPLRALTRQATDMANQRLPDAVLDILDTPLGDDVSVPAVDPVTVHTRDEVADVADALNTVQDSALDLAVEQAVLRRNIADSFVNLGRRNQNLLGRQLDFITELEHNEADPDTLGNLFRLDHLATRMRRNAESLLVLAGIDPPRKWAAPVRITDAIRAALGEVEDYQRVTVRAVEPTTVLGSAAADLAHLLAELIENALIFSPPDQTVEVRGRNQPTGYTLSVIDAGLGMPPDELARANRRLAGAESFTIAPSKYLGHYVAGNLAARHNINVTLHSSQTESGTAGITATINLPPSLLTVEPATHPDSADTALGAPQLAPEPGMAMASPASPFDAVAPPPAAVDALPLEAPAAAAQPPAAFAPPEQNEELPQLSAPHLRVTPGHSTHEVPAAFPPPIDQPPPAQAPPPAPLGPSTGWESEMPAPQPSGDNWPAPQPSGDNWPAPQPSDDNWPAPQPATPVAREEPPQQDAWPQVTQETPVSPFAPRSTPPRSATTQPARPSEELLKTLATYTTHLHRTIDTSRLTPPTGNPGAHFPNHGRATRYSAQGPQAPAPSPTRPNPRVGGPLPPRSAPEHTNSGLARRVRGAQIPRTQPVGLHRPDEPNVPANGQEPLTQTSARGVGDVSSSRVSRQNNTADPNSAKDVYSFLSSFSAGVQRGLDEARGDTRVPEEDQ